MNIINNHDDTINIINNTINNKKYYMNKNSKNFSKKLKKYLSTTPNLD